MMKLRINPLAAKDLRFIKDFIAEDNADKAVEICLYSLGGLLIHNSFEISDLWEVM